MRYRLRPVRPRHRARLRLTLATLLLPLIAIVVLPRLESARHPLAEREAALAVDLRRPRAGEAAAPRASGEWTAPAMAAVTRMPRLAGNRELQLRLAGMFAGALAVGVAVRLGTRLFAPRVGVLAASLLLALPSGRSLLGAELSVEPFFLLAMLSALLAIRGMPEARIAAVFAGGASGVAIALGGVDGLWLPVLALVWLRVHQGLNARSASVVLGTTVLGAAVALVGGWLLASSSATLLPSNGTLAFLDEGLLERRRVARDLLPLAPMVLLGLFTLRLEWLRSMPFRFLFLWLAFAGATWAATGAAASAYVAVLFLLSAVALLGWEHASRRWSWPAVAATAGIALALWRATPATSEAQAIDRWAIREAGRFVGRVIAPDRRVAASPRAAHRFTFYGNRAIEPLSGDPALAELDYVIVPRDDFRTMRARAEEQPSPAHLKRIAEFGTWVVARVRPGAAEPRKEPAGNAPFATTASPYIRPDDGPIP